MMAEMTRSVFARVLLDLARLSTFSWMEARGEGRVR